MKRLGCIADDFTGASDLANVLARGGLRVVQFNGIPTTNAWEWDAAVISLKIRSTPAEYAVEQSLDALRWLRSQGCDQTYFKYCSTFDSTPRGNIGPVAEALLEAHQAKAAIVCPAFPSLKRTIYNGYLFVGSSLLNESGMEHHPLHPMTDAHLVRWLGRQTGYRVGKIEIGTVREGSAALHATLDRMAEDGVRFIVCDCLTDADLEIIGGAVVDMPLVTGGSGLAAGLLRLQGQRMERDMRPSASLAVLSPALALAGSCSSATREQIRVHALHAPTHQVDIEEVVVGRLTPEHTLGWIKTQPPDLLPLVYSSADPVRVTRAQERHGVETVAAAFEAFFGALAKLAVAAGIQRLIIAGGETSSAVVTALGVDAMEVGPEIDPGVPVLFAENPTRLSLALKSGNFGTPEFFDRALRRMQGSEL